MYRKRIKLSWKKKRHITHTAHTTRKANKYRRGSRGGIRF